MRCSQATKGEPRAGRRGQSTRQVGTLRMHSLHVYHAMPCSLSCTCYACARQPRPLCWPAHRHPPPTCDALGHRIILSGKQYLPDVVVARVEHVGWVHGCCDSDHRCTGPRLQQKQRQGARSKGGRGVVRCAAAGEGWRAQAADVCCGGRGEQDHEKARHCWNCPHHPCPAVVVFSARNPPGCAC